LQITAIDNPPWTLSLEEAIQWFHSAIVYAWYNVKKGPSEVFPGMSTFTFFCSMLNQNKHKKKEITENWLNNYMIKFFKYFRFICRCVTH
jgi:poly-beta-hydroxyalkanoate depolymerase